jgi:hypothetical protein
MAAEAYEKGEFMRTSRRKLAVIAAGIAVLAFAGAAFAYFTNAGSGAGTATVGTSSEIELSSVSVDSLYPGGPDVGVTVYIHNPGAGNQNVNDISGVVEDNGACLGSWFEVDTIDYNTDVDPGDTRTSGTVVRMLDSGTNQDACKDATMDITWSSN